MYKPYLRPFLPLFLCAALATVLIPIHVGAAGKPLIVVVAAASTVKDISMGELRRAFLGEAVTVGGKRLIPINHPLATPARDQFDKIVLGLKPDEVGRFWVDRSIRAQSPPPKTVQSPELAVRIAMSLPGAITYTTPDNLNDKLRAVTIDGKAVGQSGYPLN
jgi:hypothetical protein